MKGKLLIALIVMLSVISTSKARADFLYAITLLNDELLSINPSTGAGTLIGKLDSQMSAFGLADRGTAIYTFDQKADKIRQLDPATGHTLATIDIGIVTDGEGAITFRSDGIGFLTRCQGGKGTLWSFDITVPSSTMITSYDLAMSPSMDGLDFDASDVLYGLRESPYQLYTIDQANADTTLVGSTGLSSTIGLGGLTFASDGTLYGVMNDALYTLNSGTGAATLVGAIGFNNVSGLTAVVPLPGATLLGMIGLSVAGIKLRKFA